MAAYVNKIKVLIKRNKLKNISANNQYGRFLQVCHFPFKACIHRTYYNRYPRKRLDSSLHIETRQLICIADHLTGFYMIGIFNLRIQ